MNSFAYLLNAMEYAAQQDNPADTGYSVKRAAVFEYVWKLEARRAELEREVIRLQNDIRERDEIL